MAELTENLVRLKLVRGLGNALLWRLLERFGDSDAVLGASEAALCAVAGMTRAKAALVRSAGTIDPRPEMEKAVEAGVDIIPYDDPAYPAPLRHSFDPPAALYVRGRLTPADQVAVGIVGTRHLTPYGRDYALALGSALARGGYTVVSGLARGIDTQAHLGALDAGGRTVGVLGCGFDHMYPAENRDLALEMSRSGAVVTEFPMATSPSRETFPARNRIIAAMSLGVVVVEAPLRSGALITARQANAIGRTVFAVPGRMGDAGSEGCNQLIRDGAVMVTSVQDIFRELNPALPPLPPLPPRPARRGRGGSGRRPAVPAAPEAAAAEREAERDFARLGGEERQVLGGLGDDWRALDEIAVRVGMTGAAAMGVLSLLVMKGLAEEAPGRHYRLRDREDRE